VLAWKKSADGAWGLRPGVSDRVAGGAGRGDGHFALGRRFLFLLRRFYLAGHLVLLAAGGASVHGREGMAMGPWSRTVWHRAGLRGSD